MEVSKETNGGLSMRLSRIRNHAAFVVALSMLLSVLTACGDAGQNSNTAPVAELSGQNAGSEPAGSEAETGTSETAESSVSADTAYENKLFDSSYVHQIDIAISDADWSDLTANPIDKTKYEVSITIDGETVSSVSFATKGNTSLSSVADDKDSDRYSFKVNFGKYVDGQTYYGLNKLNLNNLYADATFMKDYLSYDLFRQAGVDAPLTSYVWLTVNGKDQGLYLAIEDISESYLERTNDGAGELYKPETEMLDNMDQMGGGNRPEGGSFQPPENGEWQENGQPPQMQEGGRPTPPEGFDFENMTPPDGMERPDMPENGEKPAMPDGESMPEMNRKPMGGMDFGGASNGADLAYADDSIESYSDIFDNDETDADDASKQRVIAALKGLSEGKELETYLDTDEIIRYFAAHNFVLNYDSYTGNMLHNYYLYEKDGRLSMLPWDYNLAFGGFGGKGNQDATALMNTGIDTPLSGADESARPMWAWIKSSDQYLEAYHQVYQELLTNYFESGEFEKQIDSLYEMLLPYIEKDTGAFYQADAFKTGYETLKQFCLLRAESIRLQLDGTLSADTAQQAAEKQVFASAIEVEAMGSHGFGAKDGARKAPSDHS